MASKAILDLVVNLKDSASQGLGGLTGGLGKLGLAGIGVQSIIGGASGLVQAFGDLASAGAAEKLENDQLLASIQNTDKAFQGNADTLNSVVAAGEAKAFADSDVRAS